MAEIRINATGGVKLYDADDSHYAQIIAGTITSNVDAITLGHDTVTIADNLSLGSDSSVLKFGADGDTTLTHTDGTGLTLNSTNKLCFNDASQYIQGGSNAILDIAATDEIELTATLLDVNANLDVSGTSLLPTLGVITAKDLGVGIHIRTADSGASVAGASDELIIEGSAHCGMTFLTGTSQTSSIAFGDSGDNDIGLIEYNHSTDKMVFWAGANKVFHLAAGEIIVNEDGDDIDFRIESDGQTHALFLNGADNTIAFNESAPDTSAGGICLNQGSEDVIIMSCKSSDVAHGMTGLNETDTFFAMKKRDAAGGGMKMTCLAEAEAAFRLEAFATGVIDTEASGSDAAIYFDGRIANGTSVEGMAADSNLAIFGVASEARFIIKADGELHSDTTGTVGTYDKYDDAQLVRAISLNDGKNVIDSKFDKWVQYKAADLVDAKILGKDDEGNPTSFINITGLQRLHNGAIWQQYEKHQQLLEAVYDLAKKAVGKEEADSILDKHEVKRLQ